MMSSHYHAPHRPIPMQHGYSKPITMLHRLVQAHSPDVARRTTTPIFMSVILAIKAATISV